MILTAKVHNLTNAIKGEQHDKPSEDFAARHTRHSVADISRELYPERFARVRKLVGE